MKLSLPRPPRSRPKLPLHEALALDCLQCFAGNDGIAILSATALLVAHLEITEEHATRLLSALTSRNVILLANNHFAILAPLGKALKRERDRNVKRERQSSDRSTATDHRALNADWTLRNRVLQLFPSLRGPVERPASYNRPAAFSALLNAHRHHHKNDCPTDVEILTEACYAGELSTVLTMLEEQRSANRLPVLLYTRKAVYVGVLRTPKR